MKKDKIYKVLALDTSSSITGWAIFINGEYSRSGNFNFKKMKDTEQRTKQMCLDIARFIEKEKPTHVAIEELPSTRNAQTTRLLSRIIGAVYYHCIRNRIPYEEVSCDTWRHTVGINKKFRDDVKQASIERAKREYGKVVKDDEADAINIGDAYCIIHNMKRNKGEKE